MCFLYNPVVFRFHVNLPGRTLSNTLSPKFACGKLPVIGKTWPIASCGDWKEHIIVRRVYKPPKINGAG